MGNRGCKTAIFASAYVIILAFLQTDLLFRLHSNQLHILVTMELDILNGRPDWYAFQNRLLGPLLLNLALQVLPGLEEAWFAIFLLLNILKIALLIKVANRMGLNYLERLLFCLGYLFIEICLQDYFLFTWDALDQNLFIIAILALLKQNQRLLIGTYILFLLNRESVLYIPIIGILFVVFSTKRYKKKVFEVFGWIAGLAGGIQIISIVRDKLFISSGYGQADPKSNFFIPLRNLKALLFNEHWIPSKLTTTSFVAMSLVIVGIGLKSSESFDKILALSVLFSLGAIFLFGMIFESRVYLQVLPLLITLLGSTYAYSRRTLEKN